MKNYVALLRPKNKVPELTFFFETLVPELTEKNKKLWYRNFWPGPTIHSPRNPSLV